MEEEAGPEVDAAAALVAATALPWAVEAAMEDLRPSCLVVAATVVDTEDVLAATTLTEPSAYDEVCLLRPARACAWCVTVYHPWLRSSR